MKKLLFMLFISGMAIITLPMTAAAQTVKVAVMPFQIFAEKDHASLQKGIAAMLTARLAAPNQVAVIDPLATARAIDQAQGLTGDSLAISVGAALKADFILNGSITIFGENISIDTKMIPITGTQPPLTVYKQAQGMGQLIPQINLMAADIVSQAFNRAPAQRAPARIATPKPKTSEKKIVEENKLDIHAHPEKLLEELRSGADKE